jgi:hypothetical protein
MSLIDEWSPAWEFREFHRLAVLAPADAAWRAIHEVTPGEITLYQALTWLRRLGRRGSPGILNAPRNTPILETALRNGFVQLGSSHREIVIGTVVVAPRGTPRITTADQFRAIAAPGYAQAVMNFRIDHAGLAMCVVTTETRVHTTDPRTRRNFGLYWWTIRAGSGLIRRMWLRAIRRRAERSAS